MTIAEGIASIAALVAIVIGVGGVFHKLIIRPVINDLDAKRELDTQVLTNQYRALRESQAIQYTALQSTLKELRDEIKISRQQRNEFDRKIAIVEERLNNFAADVNEIRTEMARQKGAPQ